MWAGDSDSGSLVGCSLRPVTRNLAAKNCRISIEKSSKIIYKVFKLNIKGKC